jgi:hypothetical protein
MRFTPIPAYKARRLLKQSMAATNHALAEQIRAIRQEGGDAAQALSGWSGPRSDSTSTARPAGSAEPDPV